MDITLHQVRQAVETHLPGQTARTIDDLGVWIRHNYRITLDDQQAVFLKVDNYPNMDGLTEKEAFVSQLLQANGLPAPRVLAVDTTCSVIGYPFLIQEMVAGIRLDRLLSQVEPGEACEIYAAVGRFYRRLHAIHHERSGYIMGAGEVLPLSPNDYMFRQVIVENGRQAVERNILDPAVYERLVRVSEGHLDMLKAHTPTLIGGGLMWTIALDRDSSGPWQVVRLMDLPDMLYWDPAFDLAFLRYPPYTQLNEELWRAFLDGYEDIPDEKRLKLYLLIQCVDAALNNYVAPPGLFDATSPQTITQILLNTLHEVEKWS
jgi:hypothetical protein